MNLTLGLRIILARKEIGITQENLARKIGTTPSVVNHWEKDKFVPSPANMDKLVRILGKPNSYFDKKDMTMQILEEPAVYGVETNSVRLPVAGVIPSSTAEIRQEDIQGYISLPRHLFPGAAFVIQAKKEILHTKKITEKDYCIICIKPSRAGSVALARQAGGFTITDKFPRKGLEIIGQVSGILKKI
ncbi:MAG: hypothetical protein A2314_04075 [Elusimicrobia bacterium RIFOXYB2_FULL_50_12]|nr:MAG: hypothetical protein A2314_04075 [Elusimicrobia bacterium RIFOXYB2_FULL_50_12]